jgi:nicotinate-nucleotide--dimethylbenzimidazole phosphoribosyltransferase
MPLMFDFEIPIPDRKIFFPLDKKINNKTKPRGALGKLEKIALQIGLIQQTLSPILTNPHLVIFASSHGIADEGVSAYPKEVTFQMVLNFLNGGAAVNVFTKQNKLELVLVDAGVDKDFPENSSLLNRKINYGTKSFLKEKAMTEEELDKCFEEGAKVIDAIKAKGCNIVGFGEMGIGNTSSASALFSKLLNVPVSKCVGRGTGVDEQQFLHKKKVLQDALKFHKKVSSDPFDALQTFGGFEIAMMCAGMLSAAKEKMIVMVDGFIATAAFLCAYCINPEIRHYAIFTHLSNESGHKFLLETLETEPLLTLDMRLGEGTGCAIAYPIIQSAVNFLNEMASFDEAGVSKQS